MPSDSALPIQLNSPEQPLARLLFAHGAGAPMDSDFMIIMAAAMAVRGLEVVRFEFPYMAERRIQGKRRPPDRSEMLLATWDRLIRRYQDDSLPLFIGGKSMGGRMASLWAAESAKANCRGVICLGYPFHPPRKPETLRIGHLAQIRLPVLIVQGERDALGCRAEVASYKLGPAVQLCWLAAGDHDLKPLRSSGSTHAQHLEAAADAVIAFVRANLNVAEP